MGRMNKPPMRKHLKQFIQRCPSLKEVEHHVSVSVQSDFLPKGCGMEGAGRDYGKLTEEKLRNTSQVGRSRSASAGKPC